MKSPAVVTCSKGPQQLRILINHTFRRQKSIIHRCLIQMGSIKAWGLQLSRSREKRRWYSRVLKLRYLKDFGECLKMGAPHKKALFWINDLTRNDGCSRGIIPKLPSSRLVNYYYYNLFRLIVFSVPFNMTTSGCFLGPWLQEAKQRRRVLYCSIMLHQFTEVPGTVFKHGNGKSMKITHL